MDAPDEYKKEHVNWMDERANGELTDEQEGERAEQLDAIWRRLSDKEKVEVEQWAAKQVEYRKTNGRPPCGEDKEMTPDERVAVEYTGEYDLILAENEHDVVFRIAGRDVTISRGMLLDYDEKGRFWLAKEDAVRLGLLDEPPRVLH